ncbi:MAG: hypothetical protein AAFY34_14275 [Pseudomonadota bacterium]
MELGGYELFALIGFLFAAYSVVANDSIQTLGTFLASNAKRPWWVLWVYASGIMVAALAHAYFFQDGDIADGKLNFLPYPDGGIQWWHALPPLALLFMTRFSIPVSTTFLVLTIFALTGGSATEGVMQSMLIKSALGYLVAFGAAVVIYVAISRAFERWVADTRDHEPAIYWVGFQWATTAFLWWTWLKQDFANIFVFLPRTQEAVGETALFDPVTIIGGAIVLVAMQGYIFATRGGQIQKIVLSKTNTTDIRAATLIDLIYAIILYIFKEQSNIPMSTTWVFLGVIAGRELAIAYMASLRARSEALIDVAWDAGRAFIGLVVSVVLAVGMPWLATQF